MIRVPSLTVSSSRTLLKSFNSIHEKLSREKTFWTTFSVECMSLLAWRMLHQLHYWTGKKTHSDSSIPSSGPVIAQKTEPASASDSIKGLDAIFESWGVCRSSASRGSLLPACFSTPVFDNCSYLAGQANDYLHFTFVRFNDPWAVLCTSEELLTSHHSDIAAHYILRFD